MSDLADQNRQLRQQMLELVSKAQENQAILERFQQFELFLLSAKTITELLQVLLHKAKRYFKVSDCRLIWFDHLQPLMTFLDDEVIQEFGSQLVCSGMEQPVETMFASRCQPVLRPMTPMSKLRWFPEHSSIKSAAFLPLICDGTLMGCYYLGSAEKERFSSGKAVDFMAHLSVIAAASIQNNIIKEQIRLMSMVDMLTQIKNRGCFDADISKEVSRSLRNSQPLSCLFIDADHFKSVNDTYGHQVGDLTLRSLATWVKSQLREADHIARYGGEEFAILLPDCEESQAFLAAERIRTFVSQQWVRSDGIALQITLSIGISTFYPQKFKSVPHDRVVKSLVAHADAATYEAKEAGRNRVCAREFSLTENSEDAMVTLSN